MVKCAELVMTNIQFHLMRSQFIYAEIEKNEEMSCTIYRLFWFPVIQTDEEA